MTILEEYSALPDITAVHEFEFEGDAITVGSVLKFKDVRDTFKFRCLAHNKHTGTTWIDCYSVNTSELRSFRVEKLKELVKPKRRRKVNAV